MKTSLKDVLRTFWRRLQYVLARQRQRRQRQNTSLRRLQYVYKMSSRRLEYVLKTCWRHLILKKFWKHVEDVFWRHMAKANIFVLIKMSWRCLDVFKTSSSRMFAGIDVPKKTTQSSKENSFAGVNFYKDAGLQSQVLNSN